MRSTVSHMTLKGNINYVGPSDTTTTLDMTGTADIYYSTQGMSAALEASNAGVGGGFERTINEPIWYE